jgi:hypothetical protein
MVAAIGDDLTGLVKHCQGAGERRSGLSNHCERGGLLLRCPPGRHAGSVDGVYGQRAEFVCNR